MVVSLVLLFLFEVDRGDSGLDFGLRGWEMDLRSRNSTFYFFFSKKKERLFRQNKKYVCVYD